MFLRTPYPFCHPRFVNFASPFICVCMVVSFLLHTQCNNVRQKIKVSLLWQHLRYHNFVACFSVFVDMNSLQMLLLLLLLV